MLGGVSFTCSIISLETRGTLDLWHMLHTYTHPILRGAPPTCSIMAFETRGTLDLWHMLHPYTHPMLRGASPTCSIMALETRGTLDLWHMLHPSAHPMLRGASPTCSIMAHETWGTLDLWDMSGYGVPINSFRAEAKPFSTCSTASLWSLMLGRRCLSRQSLTTACCGFPSYSPISAFN